jgi:hypothetical protein
MTKVGQMQVGEMRKRIVDFRESVSKRNRAPKPLCFNDLDNDLLVMPVNFIALGASRSYDCDPKAEFLNT